MKTFLAFLARDKKIVLLLTAIISEVYSKQQQKQNRYETFISPNKFLCVQWKWGGPGDRFYLEAPESSEKKLEPILEFLIKISVLPFYSV